jgi:hypothetical protein
MEDAKLAQAAPAGLYRMVWHTFDAARVAGCGRGGIFMSIGRWAYLWSAATV